MRNRAHVTSEWGTGHVTIQVSHEVGDGHTLAYVAEQISPTNVPRLAGMYLPRTEGAVERESKRLGHGPGIQVSEEDAVLIWEALDEYLHNTGNHPSRALEAAEAKALQYAHDNTLAAAQIRSLEQILDAERHHLSNGLGTIDRERETVDRERGLYDGGQQMIQQLLHQQQQILAVLQQAQQQPDPGMPDPHG
jgi:hypothetical protein